MPPLHAGQLRYHDFTLYLDAVEQRRLRQQLSVVQPLSSSPLNNNNNKFQLPFQTTNRFFSGLTRQVGSSFNNGSSSSSSSFTYGIGGNHNTTSSHWNYLHTTSLPTSSLLSPLQKRPFLTSLRQDLHLKQLERIANTTPSDPNTQFEFLSQLAQTYPDAVIERFEQYKEFAIDERIVLLYLNCLQRASVTGVGMGRFGMKRFMDRIGTSGSGGNSMVSLGTMEALRELSKEKLGKGQMLSRVAAVVAAGGGGGGHGMPGSHFGAAGGAGGAIGGGGGGMFGMRGTSPNSPLFIQTHNPKSTRDMLFAVVRTVAVAFVLVSALTVVFTESGLGRGGMGAMGNGKHIQEAEGSDVRFDDVKGVTEAKNELEEIVLYLKDPDRFTRLGGKLPRGLLLTGPPGTGKTLLAKAIAGEAGVPFFFASGSQFEEVYVGLGAKRIRELFEAAKQKSPSIIFIDEIDAVGGTRKLKDQSALKQTLNELLVQMDGFDENSGIIVIGATNFAESLDSALLRPGRFDKNVAVPLPDVGGRKEILEMYAAKTKVAEDVDLGILARGTTGFSGADLYNLMNQAAVKASVDGLEAITMQVFEWAKDKILMGAERKSAVITKESAKCTAYHEAGHALVGVLTDGSDTIHKATIMPRGQALGMVTMLPEGDQTSMSYKQMIAKMDVCMGGRVAEELIFGEENVTSGASSDIQMATRIARAMVTKYGFSDDCGIVFYGGETGQSDASASTRAKIDEEVKRLTSAAYERATALLKKHSKEHKLLAETLLEYETLTGDEVRELILKGKKPKRPVVNTSGGGRGDQALVAKTKKEGKSRLAGLADKIRGGKKEDAQ
eukprot:CAMPEP_0201714276 /NCGR_PEP_ID=MMETSP0593-20130828/826_1 /ASSEMBLY_ACC=CAM_ASM_000672 /TAXON_ID=267983 /ORGANISM="Skeletonema japonicum, Strain CCMP2506" /LENGTH=835 /DNA_ID=CAMNT_0048203543 /DNA_START=72 /DNA_END=2579 /DNA_ORIENTATION=-